ncbi:hypothetical protein GCM10023085_14300 [Actinomadura viridis]|uniref:Uncharacterized Zn finger protein (UPF0148 family) n=1 Tax=Actinomadura viridis TaxID=58110 RepID=A0A931DQ73_9ACTN|nr:DUF3618 domain-containing protein [Actinomadura viridis]MBG6093802.1 uncharacterized Zn finger protein (UPF0148 family) [Actinomadura viridis]
MTQRTFPERYEYEYEYEETPAGTAALREEIEQTRRELGDTVEALAAKADVKARARERADRMRAGVGLRRRERRERARTAVRELAEEAEAERARREREEEAPRSRAGLVAMGAAGAALAAILMRRRMQAQAHQFTGWERARLLAARRTRRAGIRFGAGRPGPGFAGTFYGRPAVRRYVRARAMGGRRTPWATMGGGGVQGMRYRRYMRRMRAINRMRTGMAPRMGATGKIGSGRKMSAMGRNAGRWAR